MESFFHVLSYLEKEERYYYPEATLSEWNNMVLSYIRTCDTEYDTEIWDGVAEHRDDLVNALKEVEVPGLKPSEYFASFLEGRLFNIKDYPNTRKEYVNRYLFLIDHVTKLASIDLVHFIGAFDGTCLNTDATLDQFRYFILEPRYFRMVVSWAGDLQTCAERLGYYGFLDATFDDILARNALTFDYPDLTADMDATNIGHDFDLNKCPSLAHAFRDYFSSLKQKIF